ncbi:MAG: M23 family metallopeptidase [Patescibacteria group bacterium]
MTKLTLNFIKYRLHIAVAKRRGPLFAEPIFPELADIKNVKKGHKVSRFFRHIFAHKSIRKILGGNLALMLLVSTFLPNNSLASVETPDVVIEETSVPLTTKRVVRYPVAEVKVTQGYKLFHPGLDLDGVMGDAIYPIKDGRVEGVSLSKYAYGNAIIVKHGDGLSSLYAHLSQINVSEGQEVTTNTVIGEMGATGRASGDHLHLEVYKNGIPVNPYSILPKL